MNTVHLLPDSLVGMSVDVFGRDPDSDTGLTVVLIHKYDDSGTVDVLYDCILYPRVEGKVLGAFNSWDEAFLFAVACLTEEENNE